MKKFLYLALIGLTVAACNNDDDTTPDAPNAVSTATKSYSGEIVQNYFTLQCELTRTSAGFFPPIAARAYGYSGVTAYQAGYHGIPGAQSLEGQIQGFAPNSLPRPDNTLKYNWAIAVNAACAQMTMRMFATAMTPEKEAMIAELESNQHNAQNESGEISTRSADFGVAVADAIYAISQSDGGHDAALNVWQTPYTLPLGDYCWLPTGAQPTPLCPRWKDNRTFISNIKESSDPGAHVAFSVDPSSDFYAAAMEVYNQVNNNTAEQVTIAQYWADDPFQTCTPTGHTVNIVNQLLQETGATLEKSIVAFAMIGVSENDAFVSCWSTKYDYMLMRPVTYIQQQIDPSFLTVIGTPPFPAYVSGHSAEIGSGKVILAKLFADANGQYAFTDLSQVQYGFSPRSFANFDEMANECANSRLYGGIHYVMDNDKGLDLGVAVGNAVVNQIAWPANVE